MFSINHIRNNASVEANEEERIISLMNGVLFDEIRACNVSGVQLALDNDANVNAQEPDGATPLLVACSMGNAKIVKILLQRGADVSYVMDVGLYAFFIATNNNFVDVANVLIQYNGHLISSDKIKNLPLVSVILAKNVEIVKLLLEARVDPNLKNESDILPLHLACSLGELEIVKLLVEYGADINSFESNNYNPLSIACLRKNYDLVNLLISLGASVDLGYNIRPVTLALTLNDNTMVKLLIDRGADINKSFNGSTLLMEACFKLNVEIVTFLISKGANRSVKIFNEFCAAYDVLCKNEDFSQHDYYTILRMLSMYNSEL